MPSVVAGLPGDENSLDFVLGDRHGASCDERVSEAALRTLARAGRRVTRNDPYAGGFTTRHYGRPGERQHALQIEINRALYMDEEVIEPIAYFPTLARNLGQLIDALGTLSARELVPR
jgi:N-formylglutamate amidohydrolase